MNGWIYTQTLRLAALGLTGLLLCPSLGAQELDTSELTPKGPPYDNSKYDFSTGKPVSSVAPQKNSDGKFVLSGKVQTLQQAIQSEQGSIDWYTWYLSVREYLKKTGNLNECDLGTEIVFYKDGRMDARSNDPFCVMSVRWRRFPLPKDTQLDALILPVRKEADMASPEEIYGRVEGQKRRY